jgi:hypothetical protein
LKKTKDLAQATLVRATARADADRAWVDSRATANKTFADTQTAAAKLLGDALADRLLWARWGL